MNTIELLRCVACSDGPLEQGQGGLECRACGAQYHMFYGAPVLLRKDNALFPPEAYVDQDSNELERSVASSNSLKSKIKGLVPSRSLNMSRNRLFGRIASEHGDRALKILVIGCGRARHQIEDAFSSTKFEFCHTDIDSSALADFMCDAHDLPFKSNVFDGVITTAVMEHVLVPDTVASEITRVLKEGGFVYSEIPFLQAVHEGAYDFTRFSLSGHRRLFASFKEQDAGMVAGPGTALVWQLTEFSRALFKNRRVASYAVMLTKLFFFWIKYFDHLMANNPRAIDAASCTYFYGLLSEEPVDPRDIISRYGDNSFSHH